MPAAFQAEFLLRRLQQQPPAPHYLLALSGGLDSVVLLHAFAQICHDPFFKSANLQVIHVHHGLQSEADLWAQGCQNRCETLAMPCVIERVNAQPQGKEGVEAAAREARYRVFAQHLQAGGLLLTAHHQDDQAETLLLRLLRGSGLSGLAAMAECRTFAQGHLVRPLLTYSRAAVLAYAQRHSLSWWEDPSNQSLDYDRNYLRHQIMPRLSERWLGAVKTLARATERVAESNALLQEVAVEDLAKLQHNSSYGKESLPVVALHQLSLPRLNNLLRYWLAQLNLPTPSHAQLQRVSAELLVAAQDRQPLVHWPGVELRRFDGRIYAMPPLQKWDASRRYPWDLQHPLSIEGLPEPLQPELLRELGLVLPRGVSVTVAFRQGGEVLRLAGRGVSKPLKKWFQEAKIPPWQRERLPLIYFEDQLVAVMISMESMLSCDYDCFFQR
ncbi:MAG: tRNA lysidine(34) synthetase TilS [Gammaproteobacteria bacterium]|nr:tRNA lysidine(34) synthetase TilS [Gammaproteobacteria bacterium]